MIKIVIGVLGLGTAIALMFFLAGVLDERAGNVGWRIEQKMNYEADYFVCKSTTGCFCTYIYKDGKVIAVETDHPNTVTDSLKAARIAWAKEFIRVAKLQSDTTIYIK